jgi:hypothetical protein
MSAPHSNNGNADNGSADAPVNQPVLRRDAHGRVDVDSVPDVIQWFLDFDQRVAIVKHPRVEEIFQWKQEQSRRTGEEVFIFNRAEDRLAIGIIQALAENSTERDLHSWIGKLLNALDTASQANESVSEAYGLDLAGSPSTVTESSKIPSQRGRTEFLLNCWIETLCSAEARVLGWLYQEFYGQPFAP